MPTKQYDFRGRIRPKPEQPNMLQLVELHARNAFVYKRLSTHEQVKKSIFSIQMQDGLEDMTIEDGYKAALTKDDVKKLKEAQGYEGHYVNGQIIVEEKDLGISGTLGKEDREGLGYLVLKIENDEIESVYVVHISRLFRDQTLIDGLSFGELCKAHNVVIVMPNMRLNLRDKMHMRIYRMELERAADELEILKMRMGGSKELKAKRGYYVGSSVPIGYIVDKDKSNERTYDRFVPYEPHAAIVRQMFHYFQNNNFSPLLTARSMRRDRIFIPLFPPELSYMEKCSATRKKNKTDQGYTILTHFVSRTVTNPAYIGWWVWAGEVISKSNHDPIIDEELFWYVQDRIQSRSAKGRAVYAEPLILEGLLHCVSSRHAGRVIPIRSDHVTKSYRCHAGYDEGNERSYCFGANIRYLEEPICEFVLSQLSYADYADKIIKHLKDDYDDAKAKSESAKRDYERISGEVDRLKENLAYTKTPQQVDMVLGMIEEKQKELKRLSGMEAYPVGRVANRIGVTKVAKFLANLQKIWPNQTPQTKNEFFRILIDRILVDAEKRRIVATIVWKGGFTQKMEIQRPSVPGTRESRWTEEELKVMREYYATASWEKLGRMLPDRCYDGIMNCAKRLRLKREVPQIPRTCDWRPEEDEILLKKGAENNLEVIRLAERLNRTPLAVFRRLRYTLKAYRPKFNDWRKLSSVQASWKPIAVADQSQDQLSQSAAGAASAAL